MHAMLINETLLLKTTINVSITNVARGHLTYCLQLLCVLPLATAPFQRLLRRSGTVCQRLKSVRSSPSLQVFCSRLKIDLFAWSYSH